MARSSHPGWFAVVCSALGLLSACGDDRIQTVGIREDGLEVVCTPGLPGQYACDPQAPADGEDACASWAEGGPAVVLWPPNHKMRTVTLAACAAARSECDVETEALEGGRIVSVTSDEPLEVGHGGDGNTPAGDLALLDSGSVALRAERQGGGDGRVYRLEIEAPSGARDACEVHVPHDQGPFRGAFDSGPAVQVDAP